MIISPPFPLCSKQSFQSIPVILLTSFHTLIRPFITLTSNDSRHSLLLSVSHSLSFSFLLSLSRMGVHRQILFNNLVTPSTHAIHSIRRFSFETERLVSPSFSFSFNHLHNHSFPQFQLNGPFILPSLLHSPFSSFLSPFHSPSSTQSIPILPFTFHPHRIASLSHPLPIHSPSSTQSIPILPFKFHPHRIASLSHALPIHSTCLSLSIPIPILQHCPHRCASLSHASLIHS